MLAKFILGDLRLTASPSGTSTPIRGTAICKLMLCTVRLPEVYQSRVTENKRPAARFVANRTACTALFFAMCRFRQTAINHEADWTTAPSQDPKGGDVCIPDIY